MSTPAGWYDDPEKQSQQRYWDGETWTERRRPKYGQPAPQPEQAGQTAQHGQVFGGAPQQYGQPFGQPQAGPQYGQPQYGPQNYGQQGYPAYPQQQGYGYPGQRSFATPDGQPLSGWWRRFGARFIDHVLVFFLSLPVTFYFWMQYLQVYTDNVDRQMKSSTPPTFSELLNSSLSAIAWTIPATVLTALVMFGYEYLMMTRKGATVGKLAFGIAVRLRDVPGPPPAAAAAKRAGLGFGLMVLQLIPVIGFAVFLVMVLNYLWPLWDDKKQALWDKAAGTNVVRT